ncbi:hypothetical protein [Glycomyces sp. NPDC021274]|uniref:hypothetical protein n=1 Tax=Glycomyces sp. NPDC021274 TaxID=3155120 RepID=UPI0033FDBEE0
MRVAVVHGIRRYRGAPAEAVPYYTDQWLSALSECQTLPWHAGDQIDLHPAYYSHLLIEPGAQGNGLTPDAQELLAAFLDASYNPDTTGAQGPLTWPARAAIAALANRWKLPEQQVTRFLERFVSEVAAFLRTGAGFTPKADVIETVAEAMEGADIVIAHSLGSIVAYETLWAHQLEIPLLITIGSPLAVPQLHPRLTPTPVDGLGARPPGVRQWSNLADRGDFIAIPPGGIAKAFTGVDEDLHGTIAPFDFHKITNYLRSRTLGEVLTRWHQTSYGT